MSILKIAQEVDNILDRNSKQNKQDLTNSLILPFRNDYPFSTNGVYFYCGKMGSGKTYGVIRHLMITERLANNSRPYYDQIVISATSGSMDATAKSFIKEVKSQVEKVNDVNLMLYLNKNVKQKGKYYAIMKFVNSEFKTVNETMQHIIKKHHLIENSKVNLHKATNYIMTKLNKYPFKQYPSNTILILDDYGGHKLLNKPDSPLANFITKVRHYNYTVVIMCQTWRHICLNLKRLCTDFVIFQGYSINDFQTMIEQSGATQDWHQLYDQYKNLISPRSYMRLHLIAGKVEFINIDSPIKTLLSGP